MENARTTRAPPPGRYHFPGVLFTDVWISGHAPSKRRRRGLATTPSDGNRLIDTAGCSVEKSGLGENLGFKPAMPRHLEPVKRGPIGERRCTAHCDTRPFRHLNSDRALGERFICCCVYQCTYISAVGISNLGLSPRRLRHPSVMRQPLALPPPLTEWSSAMEQRSGFRQQPSLDQRLGERAKRLRKEAQGARPGLSVTNSFTSPSKQRRPLKRMSGCHRPTRGHHADARISLLYHRFRRAFVQSG